MAARKWVQNASAPLDAYMLQASDHGLGVSKQGKLNEACLRSAAGSMAYGRLVAPSTTTRCSARVLKPSHSCMNSFLMPVVASCSVSLRMPRKLSTSSVADRTVSSRRIHSFIA